ncbi:hypothetical protein BT69DRAFT_203712 [Atractiella rhizophila]|nr:hypothetical protein BT69DRAFT_203712 [Atractiella rhizophila]
MNATEDIYVWRKASSKLYSLADFRILHPSSPPDEVTVIVFPEASYQRVIDMNGVEYFPSSSDGLVWLRDVCAKISTFKTNTSVLSLSENISFLANSGHNWSATLTPSKCVASCGTICDICDSGCLRSQVYNVTVGEGRPLS